jgi:hypothetical protein
MAVESPQRSEDLKRTARPAGTRPDMQSFNGLLEEIPHQAKTDHKIAVRIIWRRVKVISGHGRIEMFGFEIDACLAHPCIDKEIEHWEPAYLALVLHIEFTEQRVVIVRVIFCKIAERNAGLYEHSLLKEIIVEVKRISRDELRNIQDVIILADFLVKDGIVEAELAEELHVF